MRVVAITSAVGTLALVTVLLRLWTRFMVIHSPGIDDYVIVGALACGIVLYACILVEYHYGIGVPEAELAPETISQQLHYLWLSVPFYNISLVLSKISGLFFYLRIFPQHTFRIWVFVVMTFLIIAGLWMLFSGFIFCMPVNAFWDVSLGGGNRSGHCLPDGPVWFTNAGLQIFTDLVIMIMPMPLIWRLQLPRLKKIGVILIFCVGIFVIATSSARLYEMTGVVNKQDFTRNNAAAGVWSSLEVDVSLICACLPPLHPLLSRLFSYFFRPRPLNSSPASKCQSHTMSLTGERKHSKHSIYDHPIGPENGIFINDCFFTGPASYSASVAKVQSHQSEAEDTNGIRVVRELRIGSDSVPDPSIFGKDPYDRDIEMGSGSSKTGPSIEWDLGDFEFPDYKERMNNPI